MYKYTVTTIPAIQTQFDPTEDPGQHYRYTYKGINLDPFRIAKIYGIQDFALQTILKKVLKCGERGHKSMRQDLLDIENAARRAIEMLDEDES
jgi:hypothetical protein